jgi:hypothetical protein
MSKAGKRDKGRHETRKKAAHTLKEKRALKRQKHDPHPEDVVGKLSDAARAAAQRHVHH